MKNQRIKRAFYTWIIKNGISEDSKYSYGKYLNYPKNKFKYSFTFDDIEAFWNIGDIFYAISVCDLILEQIKKNIEKRRVKDLSDAQSAFRKLRYFLQSKAISEPISSIPDTEKESMNKKRLKISSFKKSRNDFPYMDGNDSLLSQLGIDGFIKLAIESSFFFSPDIVEARNSKLLKMMRESQPIPCRKSEDGNLHYKENDLLYFDDNNFKCEIITKKDNNELVRREITRFTGYTVSIGKESLFKNYIISHLWGRAYDPRYFTSMWNIAIIPSWANSLMDKENPEDESFESKIQSTFRAICQKLYKNISCNSVFDFGNNLSISDEIKTMKDIVPGRYSINVIQMKNNKLKVAQIIRETYTVSKG